MIIDPRIPEALQPIIQNYVLLNEKRLVGLINASYIVGSTPGSYGGICIETASSYGKYFHPGHIRLMVRLMAGEVKRATDEA